MSVEHIIDADSLQQTSFLEQERFPRDLKVERISHGLKQYFSEHIPRDAKDPQTYANHQVGQTIWQLQELSVLNFRKGWSFPNGNESVNDAVVSAEVITFFNDVRNWNDLDKKLRLYQKDNKLPRIEAPRGLGKKRIAALQNVFAKVAFEYNK